MKDNAEDAWLIALGAAVSDGGSVNWEQAEQRLTNPDQQRIVRQLRQLASVVDAHRSTAAPPNHTEARHSATATPPSQWRHLVLFECVGAGAFGSVYRGWDPQLDREVAVKLLPRSGATNSRPLDEARNLARIRHSNVVVVHGADEDADKTGIWMEYIEGHTLAQIVRDRGPMSGREVAGVGLDLCSGVSAIHAAGILHGDIKAHNVMREVGGRIVLMDFSGAHTVTVDGGAGVFSGTPLYMAPELFDGASPSTSSDVYSLGVLLFFLLSGELPVVGATLDDVKQAHARRERRRLRDVRPDLPDGLVQVIERATAHEPGVRFRTAGELELALASASGAYSIALAQAEGGSDRRGTSFFALPPWGLAAGLIAIGLGAAAFVRWAPSSAPAPVTARFTVGPPYVSGSWPRLSPDGRLLVFGAIVEGRNRFWVRPLDRLEGRPLMEATALETPFWSPDSRTLCFFADDKLKAVAVDGGSLRVLGEAPQPHGGDWSGDTILYARRDGIYRVSATGGIAERLTAVDEAQGEYQHGWPEFLPDGRRFLFVIRSARPERSGIYVGSLDGDAPWRLLPGYSRAAYADGHLVYVREGALTAHPFDPRSAAFRGESKTIASGVKYHAGNDAAFDVSPAGVLIYSVTPGQPSTRLVLFDRRGRELRALTDVGSFGHPRFSPDGQRIVAEKVDREDNNADLWIYGTTLPSASRLTRSPAPDIRPAWSPDGERVVFSSKRGTIYDVYSKAVDGVADEELMFSAPGDKYVEHWSPDGRYLAGTVLRSGLWLMSLASGEQPLMIRAAARADTWQAEFSPDGRWVAYMSAASGKPEVYVEPFPSTGARWQVSTNGGAEPHWRGNPLELIYLDADSVLTAVRVSGPRWKPSTPQALFRVEVPDLAGRADYAVSPDGRFLVVNTFVADPMVPPIEVVLNWTALLDR